MNAAKHQTRACMGTWGSKTCFTKIKMLYHTIGFHFSLQTAKEETQVLQSRNFGFLRGLFWFSEVKTYGMMLYAQEPDAGSFTKLCLNRACISDAEPRSAHAQPLRPQNRLLPSPAEARRSTISSTPQAGTPQTQIQSAAPAPPPHPSLPHCPASTFRSTAGTATEKFRQVRSNLASIERPVVVKMTN